MNDPNFFAQVQRQRVLDEDLKPRWIPYLGLLLGAWALYSAVLLFTSDTRAEVRCGRRGELFCELVFGNIQRILPDRSTNVAYGLVYVLAAILLLVLATRRLVRGRVKTREEGQDAA
jgi:hypothetical protein